MTNSSATGELPEFSVLVTCHFEEESIDEFYSRLSATMESLGRSYEIVMVNDGSTDGTWQKIQQIWRDDSKVRVAMDFFRNSGQLAALTACMCEARGEALLVIDSDLQLAPEEIPLLVAEYDQGYDVVSGFRHNRRDSFTRILPSKVANLIMRKASNSTFVDFGCTFKIYDARLIRALDLGPRHLFNTVDAIARAGRRREIPVTAYRRKYGKSGWTFKKLWSFNMDNIVRLSERPFQYLGLVCFAVAALFLLRVALALLIDFRFLREVTTGLLLNFAVISLLTILGALSLIGEFTIRTFLASQKLPLYVVRERLARD